MLLKVEIVKNCNEVKCNQNDASVTAHLGAGKELTAWCPGCTWPRFISLDCADNSGSELPTALCTANVRIEPKVFDAARRTNVSSKALAKT